MSMPENNVHNREGRWVEEILAPIANDLRIVNWAGNILAEYIDLPRANKQERKRVGSLVTKTAGQLLQDPQRIEIAFDVWEDQWIEGSSKDRPGSFYELVKKESVELIKKTWKDITSEQLAGFIGIYANSPSAEDLANDLLRSYFKGPDSRRQRIDAYYTFVSSVLDLVGDDEALSQGVRIGLFDTGILPKDPYSIEQSVFISLPYTIFRNSSNGAKDLLSLPRNKDEERVFQKLLIAKYIALKLSAMGSKDLRQLQQKEDVFLQASDKLKVMWDKEQKIAGETIGPDEAMRLNKAMNDFEEPTGNLSEETNDEISWVQNILRDDTDPLNQKFQEVLPRIAALKTPTFKK